MYHFIDTALSFPVVIFSLLLAITMIYWLMVCLGILDSGPVDIDMQAVSAFDSASVESGKGLVARLGLTGVPASIILTLISLSGWLVSYFGQLLFIDQLSLGFFYYPLGLSVGFWPSRPLRSLPWSPFAFSNLSSERSEGRNRSRSVGRWRSSQARP
ncbi:hypothetical protein KIH13_26840 [Pseudomonas viridiflava]|nr:hypothetical protein KIH13_26840 [Pseudomonas viridiflava]